QLTGTSASEPPRTGMGPRRRRPRPGGVRWPRDGRPTPADRCRPAEVGYRRAVAGLPATTADRTLSGSRGPTCGLDVRKSSEASLPRPFGRVGGEVLPGVVELAAELGDAAGAQAVGVGQLAGAVAQSHVLGDALVAVAERFQPREKVEAEGG